MQQSHDDSLISVQPGQLVTFAFGVAEALLQGLVVFEQLLRL
jgi:hypothetical protein